MANLIEILFGTLWALSVWPAIVIAVVVAWFLARAVKRG